MQFIDRDLTGKIVSMSYQDVVQRFVTGSQCYFLDGYGNVILSVVTTSLSQSILTTDQTASYSLTAAFALNAGGSSGTTLYTASTYQITSSWSVNTLTASGYQPSLITGSTVPITSSWSVTSSYALNVTTLATGSTVPITSSWAIAGGTQLATGSTVPITASWAITSSFSAQSISSSYSQFAQNSPATTLFTASTYQITSSWSISSSFASQSLSSSYATFAQILPAVLTTGSTYQITSSYSTNTLTASGYQLSLITASTIPITSSWSITSSYSLFAQNSPATTLFTASTYQITASRAVTSSYATFAQNSPATTLFTGSTYPITSSWAVTSSYLNTGLARLVTQKGKVTEFFGNTMTEAGFALLNAKSVASSGDTIYFYGSASITNSLAKDGVDWWFAPNSYVLWDQDVVGFIFDDSGSAMTFDVGGHGNFIRNLPTSTTEYAQNEIGILRTSNPNTKIKVDFNSMLFTVASDGPDIVETSLIDIEHGNVICNGKELKVVSYNSSVDSAVYGIWWRNGDANLIINSIISTTTTIARELIYSITNTPPTGNLRILAENIQNVSPNDIVIRGDMTHKDAAAWISAHTITGYVTQMGGKQYITAQKLLGFVASQAANGKTYINVIKIGADFSSPQNYIDLQGGQSWLNVNQFEPGTGSLAALRIRGGTHHLTAADITTSGSDAIIVDAGLFSTTSSLTVLSGKIVSSPGKFDLKKTGNNTFLSVGNGVSYNVTKTTGSITLLSGFGSKELAGIHNLYSGSTGIVKRTGEGIYAIATASVDFVSPTGSLFGTSSWANNAISASWAPGSVAGTTLFTGSTYQITASWAISASWAPGGSTTTTTNYAQQILLMGG